MKAEQAWRAAVGQLQMEMSKASFNTWVRETEFVTYEDGVFVIGVKNAFARDWLESRLFSKVNRMLTGMMNRTVSVKFIVWNGVAETVQAQDDEEEIEDNPPFEETEPQPVYLSRPANPSLNARYTFDNFVVGPSNRMAHAACLAVAEKPAQAYNPLYIYGGCGLGKTHLLHAIGNYCTQQGKAVLYVSSEEFTNDLILAIRNHDTQTFREKYRQIEVLLIDDIQFLAGKESTQEEFFHTFNTLHGQDKQIVISSDRSPKALATLEERLRSRVDGGLVTDIQPPDYETRIAILRAKAERMGSRIPEGLLETIAHRIQSNIRELESSLTRIVAFSDLSNQPITGTLVETVLSDLMPRKTEIKPDEIVRVVAEQFGLSADQMLSRERTRQVALPRQVAMYLLREVTRCSLPQIGEALGGRDHSTVLYGCEKVAEMLEQDDRLRKKVLKIRETLHGQLQFMA